MMFSENGINILKELEDCRLIAYQDQAGVWTVGYGSTSNVCEGMIINQQEADTRLNNFLADLTNNLNRVIKVPLTQNQFDAVMIFSYNVGAHAFEHSTMLKLINQNKLAEAAHEFDKWVLVNNVVNHGLQNRRAKEKSLFLA